MNTLYKLAIHLNKPRRETRSHYYRYRHLLRMKCHEIRILPRALDSVPSDLIQILSTLGNINLNDLQDNSDRKALTQLKKLFPRDRRFFQMLIQQIDLWNSFHPMTVEDFLRSPAGRLWYSRRRKLKRKALFELDQPYKASKQRALSYEYAVRDLIRQHPLLTYKDLLTLGVRNAQAIYERFVYRDYHRQKFLKTLLKKRSI